MVPAEPERCSMLYLFCHYKFGKMFKGSVIGPFRIVGETTCWQLPAFQMILQTLTAHPLPGARFVAAVAPCAMFFFLTFHSYPPPSGSIARFLLIAFSVMCCLPFVSFGDEQAHDEKQHYFPDDHSGPLSENGPHHTTPNDRRNSRQDKHTKTPCPHDIIPPR